jgi:very-short-patch-repair endonuclease
MTTISDGEARALHERHIAGESVLALAKCSGYHRPSIYKAWLGLGLSWRGISEAQLVWMADKTAAERASITAAAHAAVRGSKKTPEMLAKSAAANSNRIDSRYELIVYHTLLAAGFNAIPNMAIGAFRIDVALAERKVAIEIDGGEWHTWSERKIAQDRKKEAHLRSLGWDIIRLKGCTEHRFITHADDLVMWLRMAGPRPPIRRVNGSR